MSEKPTRADKGLCQLDLLCPLCKAPKGCIGHLTEHLKNFHKPFAELSPSSKRDDRLRLSPEQKEELTKAVPKNRYKTQECKYALIRDIVAPEPPMPIDKVLPPSSEEHVEPPAPVPRLWNLQKYFDGHTEDTLNIFMVLEENEKEAALQYFERLPATLRATANVKGAIGTESPHHSVPVLTAPQPALAYPSQILDPPIRGQAALEVPFCPHNSSNQSIMAPDLAFKRRSPDWSDNSLVDPMLY